MDLNQENSPGLLTLLFQATAFLEGNLATGKENLSTGLALEPPSPRLESLWPRRNSAIGKFTERERERERGRDGEGERVCVGGLNEEKLTN